MFSVLLAPGCFSRRHFLRHWAAGFLLLAGLGACGRREPLLRIASNIWPGYTLLRLAEARGYLSRDAVRLIDMPSATACIHELAAGTLEGACLTLDEVLTALAGGIPLKVVCILDVSVGADMLLARPYLRSLADLKGQRIGVERSAAGAVMLDAVLRRAELDVGAVSIVHTPVDRQRDAFLRGEFDALITFEPVSSQLQGSDMVKLFSSADIPGRIVDVIAVRPEVAERNPEALRLLTAGHFQARREFLKDPAAAAPILGGLLRLPPTQVTAAYSGLELPDLAANRQWLAGDSGRLANAAHELARVMRQAHLLQGELDVRGLADGRFLPDA